MGRAEFTERDGQRVFYHTEVDDEFGGRGLGTAVIAEAWLRHAPMGCGSWRCARWFPHMSRSITILTTS